jgi:hypothetical protein
VHATSCQSVALELFDAVRGKFVQERRTKRAIEDVDDLAVALDAAFVELCVIGEVRIRKRLECDVWLPSDAVPAFENARPFAGLYIECLPFERRLRRGAVVPSVQPKAIPPVVITGRRRHAEQRIGCAVAP